MLFHIQSVKTGKFWWGLNDGNSVWGDRSVARGFIDPPSAFHFMRFCSHTSKPKVVCFFAGRVYNVSLSKTQIRG